MIKNKSKYKESYYLTSEEASLKIGFSAGHIRKLISLGRLKAEKFGRNWIIEEKNLSKVKRQRQRFSNKG